MDVRGGEAQADDTGDDQGDAKPLAEVGGFAEGDDAVDGGAGRADANPHGVADADGEGAHGLGEADEAEGHDGEGDATADGGECESETF